MLINLLGKGSFEIVNNITSVVCFFTVWWKGYLYIGKLIVILWRKANTTINLSWNTNWQSACTGNDILQETIGSKFVFFSQWK